MWLNAFFQGIVDGRFSLDIYFSILSSWAACPLLFRRSLHALLSFLLAKGNRSFWTKSSQSGAEPPGKCSSLPCAPDGGGPKTKHHSRGGRKDPNSLAEVGEVRSSQLCRGSGDPEHIPGRGNFYLAGRVPQGPSVWRFGVQGCTPGRRRKPYIPFSRRSLPLTAAA